MNTATTSLTAPHDPDTEREVICAAIVHPEKCAHIAELLEPDDFYVARHRALWEAVVKAYEHHGTVDEALIVAYLNAASTFELVGYKGISEVMNRAGMTRHVDAYAQIVRQYRGRRELLAAADTLTAMARDTDLDPSDLPEMAEKAVRGATEVLVPVSAENALTGFAEHHRRCLAGEEKSGGIRSGIAKLDEQMTIHPGWLAVVLAAPAMGKTALALCYTLNALRAGRPVLFVSLEMSKADLAGRLNTLASGVPFNLARKGLAQLGRRDLERYTVAHDESARWPLHIERTDGLSPQSLRLSCQRVIHERGDLGLIVLDYIQKCRGLTGRKDATDEAEFALASGMMKACAIEFDTAAIAVSQPTASATRGSGKALRLSDAKGSQAIAADADVALIPHRPNMDPDIMPNSEAAKARIRSEKQRATIGVPKFRHGPPFTVREGDVRWNGARMAYETPPGGR